jgi:hypothetical protein
MVKIFYNILDRERFDMLSLFSFLKNDFYLAGETGLAFQFGHRDSVDFDFFTDKEVKMDSLFNGLKVNFEGRKLKKIQEDKDTLTILIDNNVKVSFFRYEYPLINNLIETDYFKIASIEDIGCMKCAAILSRSLLKDYIDLYFIIKRVGLKNLLNYCLKKFEDIDISLILKSLMYYDDMIKEKINFKDGNVIKLEEVEILLRGEVNKIEL